jgi:AcrR family transcriptional regulator
MQSRSSSLAGDAVPTVADSRVNPMERRAAVSGSGHRRANVRDRRADRTCADVLTAFRDLMFERGYSRITVRAIIGRANVGRSTFYEHFRDKEDVLRESIAPVLRPLADALSPQRSAEPLRSVVEHIWTMRERTASAMLGPTRPLVARLLAELLEEGLAALAAERGGVRPGVPLRLVAAALADAQIGLLGAWIRGEAAASPDDVALALAGMTTAAPHAVLRGSAPTRR